eukprot:3617952-Rhodomonas_salina.5
MYPGPRVPGVPGTRYPVCIWEGLLLKNLGPFPNFSRRLGVICWRCQNLLGVAIRNPGIRKSFQVGTNFKLKNRALRLAAGGRFQIGPPAFVPVNCRWQPGQPNRDRDRPPSPGLPPAAPQPEAAPQHCSECPYTGTLAVLPCQWHRHPARPGGGRGSARLLQSRCSEGEAGPGASEMGPGPGGYY